MKNGKYKDLLERAKKLTKRQESGQFVEVELLANLEKLIVVDVGAEQKRIAKEILDSETKPGATSPIGQLKLPGMELYDYEPWRMIRNDTGDIIEQDRSGIDFKSAEARRARKHAREAEVWADRKVEEETGYAKWIIEQQRKGRTKKLTFGDYVRESQLFLPFDETGAA